MTKDFIQCLSKAAIFRDKICCLDLDNKKDLEVYEDELYTFMIHGEQMKLKAYHDGNPFSGCTKGRVTIGIGFNMDSPGARKVWNSVIGNNPPFDDAYEFNACITELQAKALYQYKIFEHRKYLKNSYGDTWHKLKPNEKAALEVSYYNCGNAVLATAEFGKLLKQYIDNRTDVNLDKAIEYLANMSNNCHPKVRAGLAKRRAMECELLDSRKHHIKNLALVS